MISSGCYASGTMIWPHNGEITSPYGWRTHPIYGTTRYHSGIDIGADFGDPIMAAAGGIVEFAGWASGYGNFVIIDHGNGLESCYGHNSGFTVTEGQTVTQGQTIAIAGSTGDSTGPHCHFEVRLDGNPTDPGQYLDGSRVIPTTPATEIGPDGLPRYKNSDYDEQNIDFDRFFDFAKTMRDAISTFAEKCTAAIRLVQDEVRWLFVILITIDLALSAMFNMFEDNWEPINWLLTRFLKYGFTLFLIIHWGDMIVNSIRDYFVYMGSTVAGSTPAEAGQVLSDPTTIVQKGADIVSPIFAYLKNFSGAKILLMGTNIGQAIIALIIAVILLFLFFFIGFQITMAYIEFYIIASLSVVTLGFGGLKHTKFVGEKGIGALISVSIKLMIYCVIATLIANVSKGMEGTTFDIHTYLQISLATLVFAILAGRATKTVYKLLAGSSPKL